MRYSLVQSEYEFSCMACEFNVMKRKNQHTNFQGKKLNLVIRLNMLKRKHYMFA